MKIMPESGKHRKITEKVTKVPFQKKDEKEQKAGIKEQQEEKQSRHKMKIKPETVKHRKISENAAEVPFPKKGTKEGGKTTPHKKMKGTKEERKPQSFRHKKIKVMPKTKKHRKLSKNAAKIFFLKRKEILKQLEENRKKYKSAKQKLLETKKKIQDKRKEKKDLALLPAKSVKDKKLINKRKKEIDQKIKKYVRICRVSVKEMRRWRKRQRRLQRKNRYDLVFSKNVKEKERRKHQKHRIMKILPKTTGHRHVKGGAAKVPFSKRKEISKKLEENREKYNKAKQKIIETKKKIQTKLKEKKELMLLPTKTIQEKKSINKLTRQLKTLLRICRISRKEMKRRRERRRRLQEKYRREWVQKQGTRNRKHRIMKIIPGSGRERYVPRGVGKISFSKRKELSEKLKDNKTKYQQAKQKLLKTKKELRAKIKEKKELSLLPAKTLKEKKLIQKRKEKLKQKIKKYRRICRISVNELRRSRERRRRLQEKYRREKVITKRRRYPKKHTTKIIPGAGRKPYVPRGGVKISFAKNKEILEKLKDNKKKYKQAKQKLLETKEKLRSKIKEKKELSLIPAKTLKRRRLQEKYRREKVITKRRRYPKKHTMKIIQGAGRKQYVPRGGVKISFAKNKEILEKLKDNKKKYKQAKQKLLETKEKLRAKIKEKKELSLIPAKTLKKKKLIQKRKDKLQQKIKKYRRICRISVKELRRSRERRRRLQEKYRREKVITKRRRYPKKHTMKIIPGVGGKRYVPRGGVKISFAKTKEILEKLKDNKKKYKQAKQKLLETKEKLRAKIKEKKELSLVPAKTMKKKKLIQKRKDKLQQKIKKYRRICRISVKELRRSRERRRRLQEKYRREKVITKRRRYPKKHTMKIIPGVGGKRYVPRGGVKISFAKTKEILEKLKDNKKKYKQAKQKLLETKEKLRAKIKEKKELSLIPAKTIKKKKLIQKRKDKLQQKIKKYRRICRISVKELRRSRERKRRLQEKYLPQKTKQNKRKSMRIVPSNRKTRKLTKGTMKIMFKRRNPSKTA
ncbi:axoneme-associated protein mst101(2) isoform X2 [Magallana gigas]|uniref:axoneme-associated protein mst101(2) isoform X2 n=1 Tax=Magallana gigas TaxID=29159 RepID=UPI003341FC04